MHISCRAQGDLIEYYSGTISGSEGLMTDLSLIRPKMNEIIDKINETDSIISGSIA
jgi:hypothetical protein